MLIEYCKAGYFHDTTCCLEKWLYIWTVCGFTCTQRLSDKQKQN